MHLYTNALSLNPCWFFFFKLCFFFFFFAFAFSFQPLYVDTVVPQSWQLSYTVYYHTQSSDDSAHQPSVQAHLMKQPWFELSLVRNIYCTVYYNKLARQKLSNRCWLWHMSIYCVLADQGVKRSVCVFVFGSVNVCVYGDTHTHTLMQTEFKFVFLI